MENFQTVLLGGFSKTTSTPRMQATAIRNAAAVANKFPN
jgi:hypothetical protein